MDFGEDVVGTGGPAVRFGVGIATIKVVQDGLFQFMDAAEDAAANPFLGEVAEEALDQVEPGSRGGREVQMEARMLAQPGGHVGMLVGRIVVDDEMDRQGLVGLSIESLQELQKLVMTMLRETFADDGAFLHVECSK